jgi:hypothetical protein
MTPFEQFVSQEEALARQNVTTKIETQPDQYAAGGTHELYSLKECDDVVVKRIRPGAEIIERCGGDKTKAIERLKEEHTHTALYLSGYVPKTVFMEADFGAGEEWFMVQERAKGVSYWEMDYEEVPEPSEKLRQEFAEFKERYKRMRLSGRVPEDQVMVDFDAGKIWLYDTNILRSADRMIQAEEVFILLNDRPISAKAEDVWAFLQKHFAAARKLDINDEKTFLKNIGIPGETYLEILHDVTALKGTPDVNFSILRQVQNLCSGLSYFPPASFEDNIFTLQFAEKLRI